MFIRIDEFSKKLNRYESLGDSFISLTIFSFHRGMSGIIQHFRGRIAVIRRYDRHGNYIGEIINRGFARHFDFTHVRTNELTLYTYRCIQNGYTKLFGLFKQFRDELSRHRVKSFYES